MGFKLTASALALQYSTNWAMETYWSDEGCLSKKVTATQKQHYYNNLPSLFTRKDPFAPVFFDMSLLKGSELCNIVSGLDYGLL